MVCLIVSLTVICSLIHASKCSIVLESIEDTRYLNTLQLLHVVFRHGARTPEKYESYPKDPYFNYTYPPSGHGQLTLKGKHDEYVVGKDLRRRYDRLLGKYNPEKANARSTDYTRTKLSCSLVLAGLFPPSNDEIFYDNLHWQPTVCGYSPHDEDRLLEDAYWTCPNFKKYYQSYYASVKDSIDAKYRDLYDYLSLHTGLNITSPQQVYDIAFSLTSQETLGLELPEWTKSVWPNNITQAATEYYFITLGTTRMRRLDGGRLLKRIYDDTIAKIEGETPKANKNIYLYSVHENNVANQLILMSVFDRHIPPYSSYIIYEVHKIDEVWAFRILYQDHTHNGKIKVLKLPMCSVFCPVDKFKELVGYQFPTGEETCTNDKTNCRHPL